MLHRSTSRSRFGSAAAAVLVLLMLSAGAVAADTAPPSGGTFTQNGTSADASGGRCTSNGDDTTTCSELGLSVFAGRMSDSFSRLTHRNQACAYLSTYTYSDVTGDLVGDPVFESGCAVDLPNSTIGIGKGLTSVSLATTTVEVYEYICDELGCEPGPSRDVAVVGSWTGVGPTYHSKFRYSSDDGTCRTNESGKGSGRDASFVGTVDGLSVGGDSYASISNGRFTYRSRCIEI
jgi:hypothetical protein